MLTSKQDELSKDLAKSLESATSLMHELLGDIKDNATSLTTLKVKLESLGDSVEALSHIVRDGNGKGSMITRMALAEQSMLNIEESFDELKEEVSEALKELKKDLEEEKEDEEKNLEFKREKLLTKLKVFAVVAPGAIALAIMIIRMLIGESPIP